MISTIRTPTTRLSTIHATRTNLFSTISVETLTKSHLQAMQTNAKNDHQKIGTTLNDFSSIFNNYTSTTDATTKAAWGVIAQQKLNELQTSYNTNRIGNYISTVTTTI